MDIYNPLFYVLFGDLAVLLVIENLQVLHQITHITHVSGNVHGIEKFTPTLLRVQIGSNRVSHLACDELRVN